MHILWLLPIALRASRVLKKKGLNKRGGRSVERSLSRKLASNRIEREFSWSCDVNFSQGFGRLAGNQIQPRARFIIQRLEQHTFGGLIVKKEGPTENGWPHGDVLYVICHRYCLFNFSWFSRFYWFIAWLTLAWKKR